MTRLCATTHLADGANQLFDDWLKALSAAGIELTGSVGDDETFDAALVFACGLLTAKCIAEGAAREIVARPIFAGETSGTYRSVIIVRADAGLDSLVGTSGLRLAVNEYGSWSGWHGLKRHLRQREVAADLFGEHVMSGGHMASIDAVLDGRADIAGIDHSVWAYRVEADPRCAELVVIEVTDDWPAPPISLSLDLPQATRDELALAVLSLDGVEPASIEDYAEMVAEVSEFPTEPLPRAN